MKKLERSVLMHFAFALLPSVTTPETLSALPWRNQTAVSVLGGLPLVACVQGKFVKQITP